MLHLVCAVPLIETEIDQRVVPRGELIHQRRRVPQFRRIERGGKSTAGRLFETRETSAQIPRGGGTENRGPIERHLPPAVAPLGPLRFGGTGRTEAILAVTMLVGDGEPSGQ